MDLWINQSTKLLDLGVVVESWTDSPATQQSNYNQLTNRNTRRRQSRNKVSKEFGVVCTFKAVSMSDLDEMVASINALFTGSVNDLRIQRIYDDIEAYEAEFLSPSQVRANRVAVYDKYSDDYFDFMRSHNITTDNKFLLCTLTNMSLQQRNNTTIYELSLTFETTTYPYWLTTLSSTSRAIGSSVGYTGNVINRAIDTEFSVEITPSGAVTNPWVQLGGSHTRWYYSGAVANSPLLISVDKTLYGGVNRTSVTSAAKFELSQGISLTSNISGTYRIIGGYNLFA